MSFNAPRLKHYQLVQLAAEAGHVDPHWLATALMPALRAGETVEQAIETWRKATPENFIERPRNVFRR